MFDKIFRQITYRIQLLLSFAAVDRSHVKHRFFAERVEFAEARFLKCRFDLDKNLLRTRLTNFNVAFTSFPVKFARLTNSQYKAFLCPREDKFDMHKVQHAKKQQEKR